MQPSISYAPPKGSSTMMMMTGKIHGRKDEQPLRIRQIFARFFMHILGTNFQIYFNTNIKKL